MKQPFFTRLALAAAAAACVFTAQARAEGDKVDLKPKFVAGQEHKYSIDQNSDALMKRGETENKTSQQQTMYVTRKVVTVSESGAQVELTVTRVVLKVKGSPMGDISLDTDDPADKDAGNPVAGMFRPLVGKALTFDVALDGEIKDVKIPEGIPTMNNPEAVKSTYRALFRVKQGEPLTAVGESWKQTDPIAGAGPMGNLQSEANLTLKEVKDNVATVSFDSTLKFKDGNTPPGMDLKEGSIKGDTFWDTKTGTLASLNGVQKLSIANADMGVSIEGSTIVTLKRLD